MKSNVFSRLSDNLRKNKRRNIIFLMFVALILMSMVIVNRIHTQESVKEICMEECRKIGKEVSLCGYEYGMLSIEVYYRCGNFTDENIYSSIIQGEE